MRSGGDSKIFSAWVGDLGARWSQGLLVRVQGCFSTCVGFLVAEACRQSVQ